jgi:predicted transcriptional regulator
VGVAGHDDPVALAIDRLELSNKHGLAVVQDNWPVGVFAQADALLSRAKDPQTPVAKLMDTRVLVLPNSLPIGSAAAQAVSMGARRIFTIADGLRGVVGGMDYLRVAVS